MNTAIELLAPARDAETAIEAIKCGADAVYIGADRHGARAAAGNSVSDIARVVDFAHKFNVRVYVTLNTIIYDDEIERVERLINDLYRIGVDALIVQDMGILRMKIPPIALHASTQCDTRTVSKAVFLQELGFSQIVLARELSLVEIKEIHKNVNVPLEVFVHGALCVSYSGDCQASCLTMGRSANRGECAQICRLSYNLTDVQGRTIVENKHLLSLRDLNRSKYLSEMLEAGVRSFKIEGRLKDVGYVKNVVSYYRQALDQIISDNQDKYRRASVGYSKSNFVPRLEKSFNRGFTPYYLVGDDDKIASIDTPKSQGEYIGFVKKADGVILEVESSATLTNGDGLGYFDSSGVYNGFRINRVEGNRLHVLLALNIAPGTKLYRNRDKKWDDLISGEVTRLIAVSMILNTTEKGISLSVKDERGNCVERSVDYSLEKAKSSQLQARRRVLEKIGNTVYYITDIVDNAGDVFIPASVLAQLRRDTLLALDQEQTVNYKRDYRLPENKNAVLPQGNILTYHDNVANKLAEKFYREHGAEIIDYALELDKNTKTENIIVMTTRYCLRRELGYCLKKSGGKNLKGPLFLHSANCKFRLDFDCSQCRMKVVYIGGINKNA